MKTPIKYYNTKCVDKGDRFELTAHYKIGKLRKQVKIERIFLKELLTDSEFGYLAELTLDATRRGK